MISLGLISDTHSLLRPQAISMLAGCDQILHAGDIGCLGVIEELSKIAPVAAIKGNIDRQAWAAKFPDNKIVEVEGRRIYLLHNLRELSLDPVASGFDVVVSGHSHQPKIERQDGILYVNPGSAGPRRFTLPVTIAKLEILGNDIEARIVEIVS